MAEYTFKNTRPGDVVLCKVYRSPRGTGRSKASSSSCTLSANSGIKRKATDHGDAATPSTRPHLADEDDVMLFAEDIERGLLSHHDHDDTAPEFGLGETMQNVEESPHPEPQVAPAASVDSVMTLQEMVTFIMKDEEDDGTRLRVPDGEDPQAFYLRIMDLLGDDDQQQGATIQLEDAAIQTVHGPRSEYDVIMALATGVTVDELLLDVPSMPCSQLHPRGNRVVLCS